MSQQGAQDRAQDTAQDVASYALARDPAFRVSLAATDFELFGLPERFAQDAPLIDSRWRELQAQVHPDRFASQGPAEQRVAMQWSTRVNEAYRRLKDPLRRAAYLCELRGMPIEADSNTRMPSDFLMQQMEWREALEDSGTAAQVAELEGQVRAEFRVMQAQLGALIDGPQADHASMGATGSSKVPVAAADLAAAAQKVRALMFVQRFLQDISRKADALEPN